MINNNIVVVLCDAISPELENALVCGKELKEYLKYAFNSESFCNKFFLERSLNADIPSTAGILLLRGGACINEFDLSRIYELIRTQICFLRISESSHMMPSWSTTPEILGLYVPPGSFRDPNELIKFWNGGTLNLHGVDKESSISDCVVGEQKSHDSSYPSFFIESMTSVSEFERRIWYSKARQLSSLGVRLSDLNTTYISGELTCGKGVEISPNVTIEGFVNLEDGVKVGAGSILRNCRIGLNSCVHPYSIVENSIVGRNSFIGPYARIRPKSIIGDTVQIGNYVEIKESTIGPECRINHHSFIGNAVLGKSVTIGAGTITCNHDGQRIHPTYIGDNAFIGSGCNLIAPLEIGKTVFVGAGSTITSNIDKEEVVIARSRQLTIRKNNSGPKSE
jgi:NDP-sugar pyrophosphorylase family protein